MGGILKSILERVRYCRWHSAVRRRAAFGLACWVGVVSVVAPARAFAPVVIVPTLLSSAGAPFTFSMGPSLLTLLGSAIPVFILTSDDGFQTRIPLAATPEVESLMAAPFAYPHTPGSVVYRWSDGPVFEGGFQSAAEACAAAADALIARNAGRTSFCAASGGMAPWSSAVGVLSDMTCGVTVHFGSCSSSPYSLAISAEGSQCPVGYAPVGNPELAACDLIPGKERIVTPDHKCDLQLSGSGTGSKYVAYDDFNCPNTETYDPEIQRGLPMFRNDGKIVRIPGRDSSGRPVIYDVLVSDLGDKTILRKYTQDVSGSNSVVTQEEVTIDRATAKVTNVTSSTTPGSFSGPTTQTMPYTTLTEPTAADSPVVQQTSTQPYAKPEENNTSGMACGGPGQPACVIEDGGFNRAAPVVSVPEADLNKTKENTENIVDPGLQISWMPSLTPGAAVACRPLEFRGAVTSGPAAGLDHTTQLDICWAFEIGRAVLGYLFWLGGALYVWRRFTGAN